MGRHGDVVRWLEEIVARTPPNSHTPMLHVLGSSVFSQLSLHNGGRKGAWSALCMEELDKN